MGKICYALLSFQAAGMLLCFPHPFKRAPPSPMMNNFPHQPLSSSQNAKGGDNNAGEIFTGVR